MDFGIQNGIELPIVIPYWGGRDFLLLKSHLNPNLNLNPILNTTVNLLLNRGPELESESAAQRAAGRRNWSYIFVRFVAGSRQGKDREESTCRYAWDIWRGDVENCTILAYIYRESLKGLSQVWWFLFLLLLTTTASTWLQHSRNLGTA